MQIITGPLIFTTTGIDKALVALPAVAAFAEALERPLTVVHVRGQRYRDHSTRRVAAALDALPPVNGQPRELLTIEPKQRRATLAALAVSAGGVLVMAPTRHGFVNRLLAMMADYEKQLFEGPLPILALPKSLAITLPIRRVLFPLDLSPRSEAALDQAALLAARLGSELHVLHVFGPDRRRPEEIDQAARNATGSPRELLKLDQDHIRALSERAGAAGAKVVAATAEGRAHAAILGYAKAEQIDLLVMASHGPRSGEDIWYGTTTAQVIRGAQVPVLALLG